MERLKLACIVVMAMTALSQAKNRHYNIKLENNGYENILIAIHKDVRENWKLVKEIKKSFIEASKVLYTATNRRAYFRDIRILVPRTWSDQREYKNAVSEFTSNADIIIKPHSPTVDDGPFVKSLSGCGIPGEYMQISDKYFIRVDLRHKKYGPTGKQLIHEWAHLRWGVFDEYPTGDDPAFYKSKKTGKVEPTGCVLGFVGKVIKTGTKNCYKLNSDTGLYNKGCLFLPRYYYQVGKASMMYAQHVKTIRFFCNDKTHNSEAPNKHNLLCGGRSTWSVILESPDFAAGVNRRRRVSKHEVIPRFTIMRHRHAHNRVVLVLDESGSMRIRHRLSRVVQAVNIFVRYEIKSGTGISIILFDGTAHLIVPLRNVTTERDREDIVSKLPLVCQAFTSIGAGLQEALSVLNGGSGNFEGGTVILLTDGEENTPPMMIDLMSNILKSKVIVHAIGFTKTAAQNLSHLAHSTGGKFYYDSNRDDSTDVSSAFIDIANKLNTAFDYETRITEVTTVSKKLKKKKVPTATLR